MQGSAGQEILAGRGQQGLGPIERIQVQGSSVVERVAHNHHVGGSIPSPAPKRRLG